MKLKTRTQIINTDRAQLDTAIPLFSPSLREERRPGRRDAIKTSKLFEAAPLPNPLPAPQSRGEGTRSHCWPLARSVCSRPPTAFTLIELLVALALMALIVPVVFQGLHIASLAGEVSQRKALAARVADRVLTEAIIKGQAQAAQSGVENVGPYQFHWQLKDEAWLPLGSLASLSTPNGVNQGVVNQTLIHQVSADVTYSAQGRNFSVHLSTLINTTPMQ